MILLLTLAICATLFSGLVPENIDIKRRHNFTIWGRPATYFQLQFLQYDSRSRRGLTSHA